MMIRFLCLSVCVFAALLLGSGCATITGSIIDPEVPNSAIKTKYPYKFFISSIRICSFDTMTQKKHEYAYADYPEFVAGIRSKLTILYPQIFVNEANDSVIPIDYEFVYLFHGVEPEVILNAFIMAPFTALSVYSFGLLPVYLYSKCELQVHANVALRINTSYSRKVAQHVRLSVGLLGFLNTRKFLPDFSDNDVPVQDGSIMSTPKITSSECSVKFLNLFVHALQKLDHKKIQQLYNEEYRPKVDFILP